MPCYKGRASPKAIEKDFPHILEMRVPLGDFGSKLPCSNGTAFPPLIQQAGATKTIATTFAGALLILSRGKSNRRRPALETPLSGSLNSYSYGYTNAPQCLRRSGGSRFHTISALRSNLPRPRAGAFLCLPEVRTPRGTGISVSDT